MQTLRYYGDYILGSEVQWETFCLNFSLDWLELKAKARKSVIGEIYLVELWNTNLRKLMRAKELGMVLLKQYQAAQLGTASHTTLKNEDGITASFYELYSWLYSYNLVVSPTYIDGEEPNIETELVTFDNMLSLWVNDPEELI